MVNKNFNSFVFLIKNHEWAIIHTSLFIKPFENIVDNANIRLLKEPHRTKLILSSGAAIDLMVALERTLFRNINL